MALQFTPNTFLAARPGDEENDEVVDVAWVCDIFQDRAEVVGKSSTVIEEAKVLPSQSQARNQAVGPKP